MPGNPGLQAAPLLAQRFTAWQAAFGRPIPVTNSYRDYDYQARLYASDSKRYGSPDGSLHVQGLAVDVNLPAIGANYYGNAAAKARYVRLWETARANGLYAVGFKIDQPATLGNRPGDKPDEPWHFATAAG